MNRNNLDAGYSMLNNVVRYKAEQHLCKSKVRAGKRTIDYDPAYTSQDCAMCWGRDKVVQPALCSCKGAVVKKKLWERQHTCERCGFSEHRDVNAALNGYGKAFGRTKLKEYLQTKYDFCKSKPLNCEGVAALGSLALDKVGLFTPELKPEQGQKHLVTLETKLLLCPPPVYQGPGLGNLTLISN